MISKCRILNYLDEGLGVALATDEKSLIIAGTDCSCRELVSIIGT